MVLRKTIISGKYPRPGYEVYCDCCSFTTTAGLTRHAARQHARRAKFAHIEASDRRKGDGYWLCADCYQKWDARLIIQQYIRTQRAIVKSGT